MQQIAECNLVRIAANHKDPLLPHSVQHLAFNTTSNQLLSSSFNEESPFLTSANHSYLNCMQTEGVVVKYAHGRAMRSLPPRQDTYAHVTFCSAAIKVGRCVSLRSPAELIQSLTHCTSSSSAAETDCFSSGQEVQQADKN
jgi:hypothetical protein